MSCTKINAIKVSQNLYNKVFWIFLGFEKHLAFMILLYQLLSRRTIYDIN